MPDQFDPDFPARYRKLPVTVEAIRYTPGTNCIAVAQFLGDDPGDLTCTEEANHQEATYAIATLEGVMHASPGDYIIRGVHGEHYPCRGSIFEATYERADTPVIPGQNPGKPTAETVADALIRYETGGCCGFGQTCGLCDCGRAEQTPERQREWDAHQLDRARAVMALIPPQRCAPRPNIRKGSIMNGELPELHDPNWITGRSLDQKLADWESLAKRGQVHDGNQTVLDLVGQVREHLRLDAPTTVKPNGEAVPEQRCAPSEDEVSDALSESRWRGLGGMTEKQACDYMARAILDLFGDQPTVTQAKAEALREAAVEFDREAAEDWMSTDRPATDDAATRWLRNYHGSIDSTALLLAFRAGQKAAQPDGESSWIGDHLRARAAAIESGADHG